ncbi:hypothetical protein AAVH_30621, partial [Aphelenchoides avenae]
MRIDVKGWQNIVDVLGNALHNSRFGCLSFEVWPDGGPPLPNKSPLEVEVLNLCVGGFSAAECVLDIITRFRKVQ